MRLLQRRGVLWMLAIVCAASVLLMLLNWPGALKQRDRSLRLTNVHGKTQQPVAGFRMARREVVAWALRTSIATAGGSPNARQTPRTHDSKNREVIVSPQNIGNNEPTYPENSFYEYFDSVLTAGRVGVSMVLGIPTTKQRPLVFTKTIKRIIDGMTSEEAKDTIIIVLVEENDKEYILQVSSHLEKLFKSQIKSGLLEVISAPFQFHQKIRALETSFREKEEKLRWARKNLVLAYLMMYAENKGAFYVYLGYEIEAQSGFISIMKKYAITKKNRKVPWFMLDFGNFDFIGKLFMCRELSSLFRFFIAYHDRWPTQKLLDKFVHFQLCGIALKSSDCLKRKGEWFLKYSYSLFEHVNLQK